MKLWRVWCYKLWDELWICIMSISINFSDALDKVIPIKERRAELINMVNRFFFYCSKQVILFVK
ncbi:hypothetical protein [Bacillus mycoides]|uniref:hypothetical protein n=1 Tax=Bacillus mycoides TaxID=1405 RepID=UPI001495E878|nr:hypothetical protein [Bacillus mycoides]